MGKLQRIKNTTTSPTEAGFRHTPRSRDTAQPIPMRKEQKGGKANQYVTRTLQHGDVAAAGRGGSSYYSPARACGTKGKGDATRGPPRRDQVELVFAPRGIPAGKHSSRPPPAGPALRFCANGAGFGPMVPVRDPRHAKRIARAYQSCARDPGSDLKKCAAKAVKCAEAPESDTRACFTTPGGNAEEMPLGSYASRRKARKNRRSKTSKKTSSRRRSLGNSGAIGLRKIGW
jgi:hypothetical protein